MKRNRWLVSDELGLKGQKHLAIGMEGLRKRTIKLRIIGFCVGIRAQKPQNTN
jgi:hypothetical protein